MSTSTSHTSHAFVTTQWALVVEASGTTPAARAALADLCEAYWKPVFRFLLREGHDEDAARDLTQEFFTRLISGGGVGGADPTRGRFRSYLLGAIRHFLCDLRDRENCAKRGGGIVAEPLATIDGTDDGPKGLEVSDPCSEPSDTRFDREWALAILDLALTALEAEMVNFGKQAHFEALKPWLVGESTAMRTIDAAKSLGLNEGSARVAIHRLRKRFRMLVREEIARTVMAPTSVDAELQYFVQVLVAESV